MELFVLVMFFILGLCCGSFVNMLVYRTARKYGLLRTKFKKIDKNRSVCDYCGKQLHWYENVPVISWVLLGGRSQCCGKKLPILYPIVELVTGVLLLINGTNWLGIVVITLLVFLTVFDIKYMILPDFSEYILIGLAVVNLVFKQNWWQYLAVGLVSFVFFWFLSKLKIKGQQAMGDGDPLLAAFMGLWLGWPGALVAFYGAFIGGAVIGGSLMLTGKKQGISPIPFGPFLVFGTFLAWWWGETILKLLNL